MDPEREKQIHALQEKAQQALSDADLLLENGSVEAAINRGYYSIFQTGRAALLTEEESPTTHSGVIRRFGYHFVRTKQVSEEIGDILTTAQSMRVRADYEPVTDLTEEDAENLVEDAHRFVEAVEKNVLSSR